MTLHALAIYPFPPAPEDLEAIRAAKSSLNLDYLVAPVPAVVGTPTRILAIGAAPNFLCDFRGTIKPAHDPDLAAKLAWVLGEIEEDSSASLVLDQLRTLIHPDVKEIFDVAD